MKLLISLRHKSLYFCRVNRYISGPSLFYSCVMEIQIVLGHESLPDAIVVAPPADRLRLAEMILRARLDLNPV
jgi:hypothetical protein